MIEPSILLNELALICYVIAVLCYGVSLVLLAPKAPSNAGSNTSLLFWARIALVSAILLQLAATGAWCVLTHLSPFASKYGTLAVMAWTLAILLLLFDLRLNLRVLGAAALPIIILFLVWGLLNTNSPLAKNKMIETQIVSLHVMTIVAGIALFVLAFACACLYLLQNRLLKARRIAGPFRLLPPLATLDRAAYLSVAYGLPLLTLGLALGVAYIVHLSTSPLLWLEDPHNLAAFITWFLYAFYLLARLAFGWRGIRLQYVLVVGLPFLLILYLLPSPTHHFPQ
jgi:ABC-type transport system involved in cytochrome c biogenesis permease subunit